MQEPKWQLPFKTLGAHLKSLREDRQESLAEVCEAVEIETPMLECIENGEQRPPEDVLMLLINHFALEDHEALRLWENAGYQRDDEDNKWRGGGDPQTKAAMVLLALDVRIMYSDGVAVIGNDQGVVIDFTQKSEQGQVPVSRVGMSYEQAEAVLHTLEQVLLRRRYLPNRRLLPPGSTR